MPRQTRRDFLKTVSTAGAAIALSARASAATATPAATAAPARQGKTVIGLRAPKIDVVRWGVIGLGARGSGTLREALLLEGAEVRAVCDNHPPTLEAALASVAKAGKPAPVPYGDGAEAYRKLLDRDDIDA